MSTWLAALAGAASGQAISPAILTEQDSGNTIGVFEHGYLSAVTTQNPAQPGEVLTLFATGLGPTNPAVPTGSAAPYAPPAFTTTTPGITLGCFHVAVIASELTPGAVGLYQVTFALPAGLAGGSQQLSLTIGGVASNTVTLPVAGSPGPAICGAVNGASFSAGAPVAPGSIVSLFGTALATATDNATAVPLPATLSGTSVSVNGVPAPLFFVSAGQVNVQIPWETKPGAAALTVTSGAATSSKVAFNVAAISPGIFTFGSNRAVVQNQDYSINNTGAPAAPGSYITVYLTGGGPVDNPVPTGAAAQGSPLSSATAPYSATIGGQSANVLFLGLTPGLVGVYQANLQVPQLPPGDYPIVITVGGAQSNAPVITVSAQ